MKKIIVIVLLTMFLVTLALVACMPDRAPKIAEFPWEVNILPYHLFGLYEWKTFYSAQKPEVETTKAEKGVFLEITFPGSPGTVVGIADGKEVFGGETIGLAIEEYTIRKR